MRHLLLPGLAAAALLVGCQAPNALTTPLVPLASAPAASAAATPAASATASTVTASTVTASTTAPAAGAVAPPQSYREYLTEPSDHWLRLELDGWWATAEGTHSGGGVSGQQLDLLDDMDLAPNAGRLNAEIGHHRGHWKLGLDLTAAFLEEDVTAFDSNTDLYIGQIEAIYRPGSQHVYEVLAGLRAGSAETEVTGAGAGSLDDSWVEPVLGLRGPIPLTSILELLWRFDVGGFNIDDTITFQADVKLAWHVSRSWDVLFGFRYLDLDVENIDDTDDQLDMEIAGGYLGVALRF